MIVHFDVDEYLHTFLSGEKYSFSVTPETVGLIKNKKAIIGISIKSQSQITKEVLNNFPQLKLVISRTVGVDHVDLAECKRRNIAVYHIPNYGAKGVAQHAIALMLCGARRIVNANLDTHKGNFLYSKFLGINLNGKTLGVIGTGRIGLEVVKIAKSLGMNIIAFDSFKNEKAARELNFQYVSASQLLKRSDVITLHIPSTPKTKHMLNGKTISLIKKGAILVNTARGDLIDMKALVKHVTKFHAVCLDVVENEDQFSKDNPLVRFDNVILTPHIAFYTDESIKAIAQETEENIKRFKKGDKMNRIV